MNQRAVEKGGSHQFLPAGWYLAEETYSRNSCAQDFETTDPMVGREVSRSFADI
jgi:hypothetical protein